MHREGDKTLTKITFYQDQWGTWFQVLQQFQEMELVLVHRSQFHNFRSHSAGSKGDILRLFNLLFKYKKEKLSTLAVEDAIILLLAWGGIQGGLGVFKK